MIYPVVFVPGTFGSALAHFCNMHDGFYSIQPIATIKENGELANQLDGCLHISTRYIADNKFDLMWDINRPLNLELYKDLNEYNHCVKLEVHNDYKQYYNYTKTLLKPIFIDITDDLVTIVTRRQQHNAIVNAPKYDIPNIESLKASRDKIYSRLDQDGYIEGEDYFILDIGEFFRWQNVIEQYIDISPKTLYNNEYLKLCKFLGTNPRPTYLADIRRISNYIDPHNNLLPLLGNNR